jgi:hypothetical protein
MTDLGTVDGRSPHSKFIPSAAYSSSAVTELVVRIIFESTQSYHSAESDPKSAISGTIKQSEISVTQMLGLRPKKRTIRKLSGRYRSRRSISRTGAVIAADVHRKQAKAKF